MKNLFVPFKIAKALKEIGFNEPCLAWYDPATKKFNVLGQSELNEFHTTFVTDEIIPAPLYQQVEDWFNHKKKIHIDLYRSHVGTFGYKLSVYCTKPYKAWFHGGSKDNINVNRHTALAVAIEDTIDYLKEQNEN